MINVLNAHMDTTLITIMYAQKLTQVAKPLIKIMVLAQVVIRDFL